MTQCASKTTSEKEEDKRKATQAEKTVSASLRKRRHVGSKEPCMVLDEKADGYVRGEGAAALMLREYNPKDLQSHHNQAIFLAEGSAVNQDGRSSSLTAPNGNAQQVGALLDMAHKFVDHMLILASAVEWNS
eukprot:1155414-Pelagomonas_calceolata.AAC.2